MSFAIGDQVTLKSDGQLMTVDALVATDSYVCVWKNKNGDPQSAIYSEASLDLYTPLTQDEILNMLKLSV